MSIGSEETSIGNSSFDRLFSLNTLPGVRTPIITLEQAKSVDETFVKKSQPEPDLSREAVEFRQKFSTLLFTEEYLGRGIHKYAVGGQDQNSVIYLIDTATGRIIGIADPAIKRVMANEVLRYLPPTIETFKIINDLSRLVLFSSAEDCLEFKTSADFVGLDAPGTRYRVMFGRFKTGGTSIRFFGENRGNPTNGLQRYYSLLQILDESDQTVALIDYPLAYRTASSVAAITQHLIGNMPYSLGILGVGETAKNLLYAMTALPNFPKSIKMTARGSNGLNSIKERVRRELAGLPDSIRRLVEPVGTIEEAMRSTVVCDLASRYHPLTMESEELRLFFDITRKGGPKWGFEFKNNYYDSGEGKEAHPYFSNWMMDSRFQPIRKAPKDLLTVEGESATCTVKGSPVIDFLIGQEILKKLRG